MNRTARHSLIGASALLLATTAVGCKKQQDADEQTQQVPVTTAIQLSPGFSAQVQSGTMRGTIEATIHGSDCLGLIEQTPTYLLNVTEPTAMTILVESATDTTLTIVGPEGPHCNDDFQELNPGIQRVFRAGEYQVFVGTFAPQPEPIGFTTTISPWDPPAAAPEAERLTGLAALNRTAEPRYGTLTVGPDATTASTTVESGGSEEASTLALVAGCVGSIAVSAPDAAIDYAGGGTLTITSTSGSDTTLVVVDPSGAIHCNDDSDGLNPGLTLPGAPAGTWHVWVGEYGGGTAPATLTVTHQ